MKKTAENQDIKRLLLIDGIIYEMNLTPQNKDMKTAEEILKQMKDVMPYSLPQYCEPYVLEAIKLGIFQSIPPVSEEEIKVFAKKYDTRDKSNNSEGATNEDYMGFIAGYKAALSRLPQREVVGKTDKLEVAPEEKKEVIKSCDTCIFLSQHQNSIPCNMCDEDFSEYQMIKP